MIPYVAILLCFAINYTLGVSLQSMRKNQEEDIEGGTNYRSIVSLKQGVWGAQPPRSYGVFNFG